MLIGTATTESHQQEKDIDALDNVEEEDETLNEVSNLVITMMSKIQLYFVWRDCNYKI